MKVWYFTEQSYAPAWDKVEGTIRITPPSRLIDPGVAGDLLHRYLDEWLEADNAGLNIMVNEHHTSFSSLSPSVGINGALLARITKRAKILCLGFPVCNRMDPFRVAEEIALVDVLSRGRLEFGLIKGTPWELFSSNLNPVRSIQRLWEAHDLIVKALTSVDGPFSWEGEFFQYRYVNVYPRCYQQPMPPIWMTTNGTSVAQSAAEKDYKLGTFMNGVHAKRVFDSYRQTYQEKNGQAAPGDKLGYLGMAVVASTESEARRRAEKMRVYLPTVSRALPATVNPPGAASVDENVRFLKDSGARPRPTTPDGKPVAMTASVDDLAAAGILFWGTPDRIYQQIKHFYDRVGGFGNFFMEGQAAELTHSETVDSIRLFAREVYPRLKELSGTHEMEATAA
jgi:alkanesulfonate monooxygenase SsuD/methylene tetrahydromethanopterin reductase-like flavin-dependent oxidoreductase (luciferase family)